jgi:hypothetical protein
LEVIAIDYASTIGNNDKIFKRDLFPNEDLSVTEKLRFFEKEETTASAFQNVSDSFFLFKGFKLMKYILPVASSEP